MNGVPSRIHMRDLAPKPVRREPIDWRIVYDRAVALVVAAQIAYWLTSGFLGQS